jgi:hypothetical protein
MTFDWKTDTTLSLVGLLADRRAWVPDGILREGVAWAAVNHHKALHCRLNS